MRDDEERSAELLQELRQPFDGFRVEMVRRLVQHQEVRLRDDGAAEGHAAFLAAGERLDAAIGSGAIQVRHRGGNALVQCPAFQGHNAMLQLLVPFRVRRQRLELRDQIEHMLRAREDV